MPSYKVKNSIEGFGISYIEAAAYGIPSIAGIEGGVVDAVNHSRSGWCVNPLSLKELSDTLMEAINNEKKRRVNMDFFIIVIEAKDHLQLILNLKQGFKL